MSHDHDALDELLAAAETEDERRSLAQLWNDLGRMEAVEPPSDLAARFTRALRETDRSHRRSPRFWLQAAATFAIGALTGGLAASWWLGGARPPSSSADLVHKALVTSTLPHRTAAQRLQSIHVAGSLVQVEPSYRAALIDRAARDRSPAIQLAALDSLFTLELTSDEIEILARALPEIDSPIVQLTLLDLLNPRTEPVVRDAIRRLTADTSVDPLIRRHADWTMSRIQQRIHA